MLGEEDHPTVHRDGKEAAGSKSAQARGLLPRLVIVPQC